MKTSEIDVVRASQFEGQPWMRHGFSTRTSGASIVYGVGELNLSWSREDDPALVARNRADFLGAISNKNTGSADQMGANPSKFELVTVRQIHSDVTQIIRQDHGVLSTPDGRAVLEGDGLMTNLPGLMLGIQTADCIPVLLADPKTKAVAAFHAGWRGTAARIVEHGVERMCAEYGSEPTELIAAIGPGIGPCCYAVGEDLRREFESKFAYGKTLFTESADARMHLNLWEANRRQLLDAGLQEKNITITGLCTASDTKRFFSHRAEKGFTGRMLNTIGIAAS